MKKLLLVLCVIVLTACTPSVDPTLTPLNILIRSESNSGDAVYVYNVQPFVQLGRLSPLVKGQNVRLPLTLIRDGTLIIALINGSGQTFILPAMVLSPTDVCFDLFVDQHLQFSSLGMCKK